jgi:hypothetical protein
VDRIVLAVAVQCRHQLAFRGECPRPQRKALSGRAVVSQMSNRKRAALALAGQHGAGVVGRAVVDHDDLEPAPSHRRLQLGENPSEIFTLVLGRDDDRDERVGFA